MSLRSLTIAALGAASLPAQSFTSPAGLGAVEGAGVHDHMLFARGVVRFQQVDATHRGTPYAGIRSISWRRDNGPWNSKYFLRAVDLEVVMAHAAIAELDSDLPANYVGAPTVVFTRKPLSLPDWTLGGFGGPTPEPWTAIVPLDRTWSYNGVDDLLWEASHTTNTAVASGLGTVNYGHDFEPDSGWFANETTGATIHPWGCTATGMTNPMTLWGALANRATRFRLSLSVNHAPAQAQVLCNVSTADANLSLPGLCRAAHALPGLATIPLGGASPAGLVGTVAFERLPHVTGLIGTKLFFQAIALDPGHPGLPVVLSNGHELVVPNDPTLPQVAHVYDYELGPGVPAGSPPTPGGMVTRFEY